MRHIQNYATLLISHLIVLGSSSILSSSLGVPFVADDLGDDGVSLEADELEADKLVFD